MASIKVTIKVNKPKVSSFRVAGKTLREVQKALDARTEWGLYDATQNVKSGAQLDKDGIATSVTMELNPEIELPTWGGYSGATKEQKASWDRMAKALAAHEDKHHALQLRLVEDFKKKLATAGTLDGPALKKLIKKFGVEAQKAQDAYDDRSGHGAKEGVALDLDA